MKKIAILYIIRLIPVFMCIVKTFAQDYQNVNFSIDETTRKIKYIYNPADSKLANSDTVKATIYSLGISQIDPDVQEIYLKKVGNLWYGDIKYKESDVSVMIIFKDKFNNKDNNLGSGYWTSINENGLPKKGTYASIAYLYAGGWEPEYFMLTRQLEKAHTFFEKEFSINPNMKRSYYRWYLGTFNLSNDSEFDKFKDELSQFAKYEDLTEWELLSISGFYTTIKDTKLSKVYENLIFSRYPKGCWTTQMSTMELQKAFVVTENLKKKLDIYKQFNEQTKSPTNECSRRYIELRKGLTMLSKLTPYYADSNQMDFWIKEVNELSDEFKYPTLIFGAKALYDNGNMNIAEGLAKQTVNWMKLYLDTSYRNPTERSYYTNQQIREFREKRFAEYLDIYGQILLNLNKIDESVHTLYQASILYGKKSDNKINQHYVDALKKAGRLEEAAIYMQEFIKIGKSNSDMDESYKVSMKLNILPDSLTAPRRARLARDIRNQLISEPMPSVSFLDYEGKPVNIGNYQNKIVVIDYWATWCAPCIAGFESMQKVVEQYKTDQEIVFLFVDTKEYNPDCKQRAKSLFKDRNYPFILLFDDQGKGLVRSGGTALPTKIVIDKSGKIRFRSQGLEGTVDEQVAELSTMIETIR